MLTVLVITYSSLIHTEFEGKHKGPDCALQPLLHTGNRVVFTVPLPALHCSGGFCECVCVCACVHARKTTGATYTEGDQTPSAFKPRSCLT